MNTKDDVGVSTARVCRSEWTKITSLRSSWIVLATVSVLAIGFSAAIGRGMHQAVLAGDPPPTAAQAVSAAFVPLDILTLVVGVFGVLQMSGEYGTGLIRATLTSVPRRVPVLVAKAAALVALTLPVMLLVSVASFGICQAFLAGDGTSPGAAGVPGAIIGAGVAPVLMGLLGLGLGTALRSTAASITTLVGALFVGPAIVAQALPTHLRDDLMRFVPTVADQAMYGLDGKGTPFPTFSPAVSALVMVGWVVLLLAVGTVVLRDRDA